MHIIYDLKHKINIESNKEISHFLEKYKLELHIEDEKYFQKEVYKINRTKKINDINFDYLGYRFTIKNKYAPAKDRQFRLVTVDLSEKTFQKYKRRIEKSFSSYNHNYLANQVIAFTLLDKRISYLTSNYRLFNQKKRVSFINGIYYGFRAINQTDGRLKELDDYLRYFIEREKMSCHSSSKKFLDSLNKHSFTRGFKNKTFLYFSISSLKEIKNCWKDI